MDFNSVKDAADMLNKVKNKINGGQRHMNPTSSTTFYITPIKQQTTTSIQQPPQLPRYVSSPVSSTSSKQQSSTTYLNVSKSQTPDDSRGSSRSESPNAPMYSPISVNNWNRITIPNRNIPMRPDYQSSHAKISLKHTTSIDPHTFIRTQPITPNRSAITAMTSAPLQSSMGPSSMVMSIERALPQQQPPRSLNTSTVPVIRTTMDRPFNQQQSMQHGNDPRRIQVNSVYSRNVLERPQQQQNTVQSIMVDPDKTINYVNYTDQICLKTSRLGKDPERISGGKTSPNVSSINDERRSPNVKRSLSPLPESVSRKLKNGPYERFVKPCKPSMYQFFMEHHIYTLIEQYKERNQRSKQLIGEMKAAELNDKIQEKMLRVLRQKESNYIRLKRQKMNKSMFDIIKHIGVGAFGKVALVKKVILLNLLFVKSI